MNALVLETNANGRYLSRFHLCLVSALFLGPYLTKRKFHKNFPLVSVLLWSFPNHLLNRRCTCLMCWRQTLFPREWNMLCTSNERFSAGNECKREVSFTLSCAFSSTLHPQVIYMYAIAFSAGLDGLPVD